MRSDLTRLRLTLEFIRLFQERFDYPPSVREIMRGTRQRSSSEVQLALRRLQHEGYLAPRASYRQKWTIIRPYEVPAPRRREAGRGTG